MSEWREVKLGNIAKFTQGIQVPLNNQESEKFEGSVRFIRIVDFTQGDDNNIRYIKNPGEKYIVKADDLVMIRYGSQTAGKIAQGFEGAIANNTFKVSPNEDILDKKFLYYYLSQQSIFDYFHFSQASSTMPAITFGMIGDLKFIKPPIKEQKAIAEVLSSLDDKIDLLHRQNKTLEELTQTLFRQWFIEESDDEWEEYEVRDFVKHKKVSIKPEQNPNDEFLHFSLPAFDENKEPNVELGSDIKSNKYQVEPFSILMSKLNPKTPRVWDIYFEPEVNSICSTEFQVLQPNDKELFPFISTLLKSDKVTGDLSMSASGTSGSHQRVKPEDMLNINFVTPSIDRMKEFSKLLEPNFLKKMQNQQQIKTLQNMRDTLLPKLMSGEIKVNY